MNTQDEFHYRAHLLQEFRALTGRLMQLESRLDPAHQEGRDADYRQAALLHEISSLVVDVLKPIDLDKPGEPDKGFTLDDMSFFGVFLERLKDHAQELERTAGVSADRPQL